MSNASIGIIVLAAALCSPAVTAEERTPQCRASGATVTLSGVAEASGIAASRRTPGRFWVHNDSGQPVLVAVDSHGAVVGRVRLTGIEPQDWETTTVGPCPGGSCLYLGDIGDNRGQRASITVYRTPEPDATSAEVAVRDTFRATYPDGPHDAEALLVTPAGDIYVVTKGNIDSVAVYRFPRDMRPDATVELT